MDTRKKACTNTECNTYCKKKYSSKINYCPECGSKLIFVCKSRKCFKPLDLSQESHEYCFECEVKRNDMIEKAKQAGKFVVAGMIVPVANAAVKEGGNIAKVAVKKVADGVINKIK